MKENIHPKYDLCQVVCACGNTFTTRSTKSSIKVEICSECHPFYTGRHKILDTEGRVDKFKKKYNDADIESIAKTAKTRKKKSKASMPKVAPAHRKSTPTGVKKVVRKSKKEEK